MSIKLDQSPVGADIDFLVVLANCNAAETRLGWKLKMISLHSVILVVLAAFNTSSLAAPSDGFPVLDVKPLCRGITQQSSLQEGFRTVTFNECMKAEQQDRQTMINEWSTFSADDKKHCVAEATMGGASSYTDLLTCLEMSRDVRKLKVPSKAKRAE